MKRTKDENMKNKTNYFLKNYRKLGKKVTNI